MDNCQSPPEVLDPLFTFLDPLEIIWEPAEGEGNLSRRFNEVGYNVIGSDIINGIDFFEYDPKIWDVQVTNPPYSLKYQWLERSIEFEKPFCLLVPVEMIGAKRAQEALEKSRLPWGIILFTRRNNFKMPIWNSGSGAQFPTMWLWGGFRLMKQIQIWDVNNHMFLGDRLAAE